MFSSLQRFYTFILSFPIKILVIFFYVLLSYNCIFLIWMERVFISSTDAILIKSSAVVKFLIHSALYFKFSS